MKRRIVTIKNSAGIHCRPSSDILNTINREFPDHRLEISKDGTPVELNSILALISLGMGCGCVAELTVEGADEDAAIKRIGDLFEHEFDFPPR